MCEVLCVRSLVQSEDLAAKSVQLAQFVTGVAMVVGLLVGVAAVVSGLRTAGE